MNVISFFNGMNCGAMALELAGIPIDKYWSYEIDKHAIRSTQATHPETIQMGSVVDFDVNDFPEKIDLFIGGSPCQSFSFAGKRKGMAAKQPTIKQLSDLAELKASGHQVDEGVFLATEHIEILTLDHYLQLKAEGYEFEGQSYLFWEFMRALTDLRKVNPDIKFLLENVMMSEKWEKILTRAIGVKPIEINSALVSAQNRRRLYWTNIGMVPFGLFGDLESIIQQPKDRGILLKDILETEVDQKYFLSEKMLKYLNGRVGKYSNVKVNPDKTGTMNTKNNSCNLSTDAGTTLIDVNKLIKSPEEKASCFTAGGNSGGNHSQMDFIKCVAMRGRNPENPKSRESGLHTEQQLEPRHDGKTNTLTSVQKDNLVMQINPSLESGGKQPYQQNRIYDADGISPALCAHKADLIIKTNNNPLLSKGIICIFVEKIINEKSTFDKRNAIKTLLILCKKIGAETNGKYENGGNISFQQKKILWTSLYGESLDRNTEKRISELFGITSESESENKKDTMRKMFIKTEFGHSSQGRELEEQLTREFTGFMQIVSLKGASNRKGMFDLWETPEGSWLLREALPTIQKIWESSNDRMGGTRIRRLTPRECGKLQTIPSHHLETMLSSGISDTQLYRMFGNGWTVDVIAHIFKYLK